jgi:hypothetical protein
MRVFQQYTEPAGVSGRSPNGLVAMSGNAAEYAYDSEYELRFNSGPDHEPILQLPELPVTNPTFTICGGSYHVGIDDCQVESFQESDNAGDFTRDDVGFRVVYIPRDE